MSTWKTYIVDDLTQFHGMSWLGKERKFDSILKNDMIALIVTNGTIISSWMRYYPDDVLIDPTKKLSPTNLQKDFKETFDFKGAKHCYKNDYNIDISEPTIYRRRRITI